MPIIRLSVHQWTNLTLAPVCTWNSLVGKAEPYTHYAKRLSYGSFTLTYHNGLDVPRGENPSPLQVCEWPIEDHGDRLLSLTPLPLSSFR